MRAQPKPVDLDDWKKVLTQRVLEGLDPRPKGWPLKFGGWK